MKRWFSPGRRSFPATSRLPLGRLRPGLHQEQVRLPGLRQPAAGGPAQPPEVTAALRNAGRPRPRRAFHTPRRAESEGAAAAAAAHP